MNRERVTFWTLYVIVLLLAVSQASVLFRASYVNAYAEKVLWLGVSLIMGFSFAFLCFLKIPSSEIEKAGKVLFIMGIVSMMGVVCFNGPNLLTGLINTMVFVLTFVGLTIVAVVDWN